MKKIAVVLFNLGGPDAPASVRPFLVNLFSDKAILGVPQPFRWLLARVIAARRAKVAQDIYDRVGGGSPLLPNTLAQAASLRAALADLGPVQVIPAMRYWHPFSDEIAARVLEYGPDEIILLPLYPQYSTTTTASSLKDWQTAARRVGLKVRAKAVCCYPAEQDFIAALADLVRPHYAKARAAYQAKPPRILFSAHGLPKRVIERGDPYQAQVEITAAAVVQALAIPDLDWKVCYQSRVGPLEWIGPYAEDEIARAGADRAPLVVVPVAFVSEHSETLVELDMIYRDDAAKAGVPHYERVPAVGTHPKFIAGLARLVRDALERPAAIAPDGGKRICPGKWSGCALAGSPAMIDLPTSWYLWVKALHVISVIAWMAGMLYLPRLYVYHCEVAPGSEASEKFKVMERRLLRAIMNPAVVAVWVFGIALAMMTGWSQGWLHAKLLLVAAMTVHHHLLARWRKDFEADRNTRSARFYRIANEVPTLLLIGIVILVIVKPF